MAGYWPKLIFRSKKMSDKSRKKIVYVLIFIFLFASVTLPEANIALAQRHGGRNAPGKPIDRLPPGSKEVWVGRDRYFRHNNVFYRRGPSGFIVVDPPIGALVLSLPLGAAALLIGGITYYVFEEIYYRHAPGGYVVVERPVGRVVKETYPVVPSEERVGETVSVTAPLLNVRSGPGSNFPVIFQVEEGEVLTVHGYAPDWLYVKSTSNEFGWVMLKYTSSLSPPASG